RARHFAAGPGAGTPRPHSRPQYHATRLTIWTLVPAILVLAVWGFFGPALTRSYIIGLLPADIAAQAGNALESAIQRLQSIASGYGVAGELAPYEQTAGDALRQFNLVTTLLVILAAAGLGIAGL